jgi:phosphoadenosine phosphosulfate reductase
MSTVATAGAAIGPELAAKIERLDTLLDSIAARHDKVKFASSLAAEDMLPSCRVR